MTQSRRCLDIEIDLNAWGITLEGRYGWALSADYLCAGLVVGEGQLTLEALYDAATVSFIDHDGEFHQELALEELPVSAETMRQLKAEIAARWAREIDRLKQEGVI